MKALRHVALAAAAVSLLTACASREVLERRSAMPAAGVDFSGRWRLAPDAQQTNRRIAKAGRDASGGHDDILRPERSKSTRRSRGSLVYVFLETGTDLKITQTHEGLFISFDRAVVEAYRFGEYHRVRVGPIEADRSSGWVGDAYIIETLDDEGGKLHERYRLSDDGRHLIRQIEVYRKGVPELALQQRFVRHDP